MKSINSRLKENRILLQSDESHQKIKCQVERRNSERNAGVGGVL